MRIWEYQTDNYDSPHRRNVRELNFDSIAEAIKFVGASFGRSGGIHWTGTSTSQELADKMENGWPEALHKMRSMLGQVQLPEKDVSKEVIRRRKRVRSDFGNEVDIHAVRQGRMDRAWTATEHMYKEQQQRKMVHIIVNPVVGAGVSAMNQLYQGAVVMRIMEALERDGKSVALSLSLMFDSPWVGHRDITFVTIPLKKYGEYVPEERVAAALTGGFWREYLMEGAMKKTPSWTRNATSGMCVYRTSMRPFDVSREVDSGVHVVLVGGCDDAARAQLMVQNFVAKYADATSSSDDVSNLDRFSTEV